MQGFFPKTMQKRASKNHYLFLLQGSMLWLFLYWQMGPQFSSTTPFAFQILLVANLLVFFKTGNFDLFRYSQLALFLFAPFVIQWSIGNFITASGTSLWGLLAPIGAVLCFGTRESAQKDFFHLSMNWPNSLAPRK